MSIRNPGIGGATKQTNTFTGAQTLPPGTVAAPALTFGDAATGLYRPALNSIGISVNGANPLIVDSAGRVSAGFGTGNTSFGVSSATSTTGSYNSAFGLNSLSANIAGNYNTAVGYDSLVSNTTGSQNSAVGSLSLLSNTTGAANTSVGYYSMISNTTGGYNTAVGHNSLYSNNTGVQNSAFGYSALFDLSGASVSNNTGIGYNTGRGITTGVNNTIVGANVTGLAAGTTGVVILATGDGVIRADYGKTTAAVWSLASPIKSAVYTVGTLPSAASATAGARAFVTDALAPSYGATVAGGGAVNIPVYSDGTNWKVG